MTGTVEEWRAIAGYGGDYEVSDQGRVRSFKRRKPQMLSAYINSHGYSEVYLLKGGSRYHHPVHRLVGEAFIGPLRAGYHTRHKNGIRADSRLSNLCYGTPRDNLLDTVRHGHNRLASRTHCMNGHEFNEENTYMAKRIRQCRVCNKLRRRRYDAERRARQRSEQYAKEQNHE